MTDTKIILSYLTKSYHYKHPMVMHYSFCSAKTRIKIIDKIYQELDNVFSTCISKALQKDVIIVYLNELKHRHNNDKYPVDLIY